MNIYILLFLILNSFEFRLIQSFIFISHQLTNILNFEYLLPTNNSKVSIIYLKHYFYAIK